VKRALVALAILLVAAVAAGLILTWREIDAFRATAYGGPEEKVVVIPQGA
jgi:UPF0755 protein